MKKKTAIMKTPDCLVSASRQYQHNDCSGLVHGFDHEETIRVIRKYRWLLVGAQNRLAHYQTDVDYEFMVHLDQSIKDMD